MRLPALFVLCFALSGCGAANETHTYVPPQTPGGRMCVNECHAAQQDCNEGCNIENRSCVEDVQTQALRDYDKYTREQFASRGPMDLYPRDFERLGPCNAKHGSCTAACENNNQTCYEKCGGKVETTTSCQFLCF